MISGWSGHSINTEGGKKEKEKEGRGRKRELEREGIKNQELDNLGFLQICLNPANTSHSYLTDLDHFLHLNICMCMCIGVLSYIFCG